MFVLSILLVKIPLYHLGPQGPFCLSRLLTYAGCPTRKYTKTHVVVVVLGPRRYGPWYVLESGVGSGKFNLRRKIGLGVTRYTYYFTLSVTRSSFFYGPCMDSLYLRCFFLVDDLRKPLRAPLLLVV